ncbi:S41 family peptidase [Flavobacterium reichenbachii]|uniref:Peptidase S41 n=1 Tax=Flavobacterium reichenbachii TaxID=362418 RepID=A0A085ZP24_9FLAO|nr:S41 family peptidase [Flavobacterium reichenbachii]KFF06188.1 peptidase S41 [Flavobacterium reichenbachii]OXB17589.1 peptidase S41 [Flavobacterium reichenbachii]
MFKSKIMLFVFIPFLMAAQNQKLSVYELKQDLTVFKEIREKANSGLYKYRTKQQTDSIYSWAFSQINEPKALLDFYKIILKITDFEGSLHNDTTLPENFQNKFSSGNVFFPYPVKLIEDKLIVNFRNTEIPLGSEIFSINKIKTKELLASFYKYYTTDGYNISGKSIGIAGSFARYFEMEYGSQKKFLVEYSLPDKSQKLLKTITGVSNEIRKENFKNRHSLPIDSLQYGKIKNKYSFKVITPNTSLLTINTFAIGNNAEDKEHLAYKKHLDSCFQYLSNNLQIKNLIVDVRNNGGGTDPNDILTFSYLTQKPYRENAEAYVNFQEIPFPNYLVYEETEPQKQHEERKDFEEEIKEEFPKLENGKYIQDEKFNALLQPDKNSFKGQIYLLISPRIASAGSLFASLATGRTNAIVIGEETMGGYYGHNGHTPVEYELPNSKIKTQFSIVNLEQDVPKKANQIFGRGIIPDREVRQTLEDFLKNKDTQFEYTLKLIEQK